MKPQARLWSLLLFFLSGCAVAVKSLYPPQFCNLDNKTIYVVNHGKHTGIVLATAAALPYLPALDERFWQAKYIEFGWGEEDFYQAEQITSGLVMQAAFWPNRAVLYVAEVPEQPRLYFAGGEIIEIELSAAGFANAARFINASFSVDEESKSQKTAEGVYANSAFYRAKGVYFLLNNCNNWTARGLRAAGFPMAPFPAWTADDVVAQVRAFKQESEPCAAR